jgi:hypothetical protein
MAPNEVNRPKHPSLLGRSDVIYRKILWHISIEAVFECGGLCFPEYRRCPFAPPYVFDENYLFDLYKYNTIKLNIC